MASPREGFIKKKKRQNFPTFKFPPEIIFIGFINVSAHLEHIQKKMIFPLEKLKYLEYFHKFGPQIPPDPPQQPPPYKGKKFSLHFWTN